MALRLHLRNGVYLADCVIGGKNRLETLGIVDSGASVTYVTTDTLSQAKLEPTGANWRSAKIFVRSWEKPCGD